MSKYTKKKKKNYLLKTYSLKSIKNIFIFLIIFKYPKTPYILMGGSSLSIWIWMFQSATILVTKIIGGTIEIWSK